MWVFAATEQSNLSPTVLLLVFIFSIVLCLGGLAVSQVGNRSG